MFNNRNLSSGDNIWVAAAHETCYLNVELLCIFCCPPIHFLLFIIPCTWARMLVVGRAFSKTLVSCHNYDSPCAQLIESNTLISNSKLCFPSKTFTFVRCNNSVFRSSPFSVRHLYTSNLCKLHVVCM